MNNYLKKKHKKPMHNWHVRAIQIKYKTIKKTGSHNVIKKCGSLY